MLGAASFSPARMEHTPIRIIGNRFSTQIIIITKVAHPIAARLWHSYVHTHTQLVMSQFIRTQTIIELLFGACRRNIEPLLLMFGMHSAPASSLPPRIMKSFSISMPFAVALCIDCGARGAFWIAFPIKPKQYIRFHYAHLSFHRFYSSSPCFGDCVVSFPVSLSF